MKILEINSRISFPLSQGMARLASSCSLLILLLSATSSSSIAESATRMRKGGQPENSTWVHSLKGKAFASFNGKTRFLKEREKLPENTEVITEVGSLADLVDHSGRQFFLAGSGQIKMGRDFVEVKRGYLWIKAESYEGYLNVNTANAEMIFASGESILSFDARTGKTQLLVIRGKVVFQNKLNKMMSTEILAGQFSFIDDKLRDGEPRAGTAIGFDSFKKITSTFQQNVEIGKFYQKPSADESMTSLKGSASTSTSTSTSLGTELTIDKSTYKKGANAAAENTGSANWLNSFYQTQLKEIKGDKPLAPMVHHKPTKKGKKCANVPMLIFGKNRPYNDRSDSLTSAQNKMKSNKSPMVKMAKGLQPTSSRIAKSITTARARPTTMKNSSRGLASPGKPAEINSFESSLKRKYLEQTRHNGDVTHLIKELKTYSEDYKSSY
jgi:hypothetical protein